MNCSEILSVLKKLGKPQTAEIYKRYGCGDNVFGVLTSEIGKLRKKIKIDHPLAYELWRTENAEARLLALQIADPRKLTRADVEQFLADGPVSFVGCYLSQLVARTPIADETMRAWMASPDEDAREMGYGILAARLKDEPDSITDADGERILSTIEREIHGSPNRARSAMNTALICLGSFRASLRDRAIATAKRIGKVEVDHGDTYCKTPDAAAHLQKASKRRRCP